MSKASEVTSQWIQDVASHHVKNDLSQPMTEREEALATSLLQCVGADIAMAESAPAPAPATCAEWDSEEQARIIATHLSLGKSDVALLQGYLHRAFVSGTQVASDKGASSKTLGTDLRDGGTATRVNDSVEGSNATSIPVAGAVPATSAERSARIRVGLKLDGEVHIPEWGPQLPAKWKEVNGERVDAESIAKWFFQVDDPRQEQCALLVRAATSAEPGRK